MNKNGRNCGRKRSRTSFKLLTRNLLGWIEGKREKSVRVTGVRAEILTEDVLSKSANPKFDVRGRMIRIIGN
jgi:hypothetical protein